MKEFWTALATVVTRMRELPDDVKPLRVPRILIDALNAHALGEDQKANENLKLAEYKILHAFEEAGYKWWNAYNSTAGLILKDYTHHVNNDSRDYMGRFFGKFDEVWQYALDEIAMAEERKVAVDRYVKSFPQE